MVNLVFGVPWWTYVAVALAGGVVFWVADRRQIAPLRSAGGMLALLGVLLLVASFFVETDKQKCLRQSREAARDVQTQNWAALTPLLDPRVSLNLPTGSLYFNRADLLKGVQDGVLQYGLKDVTILASTVKQTQTIVTVDLDLLTEQDATMGRPVRSGWEMEWQEHGRTWLLYRLTCRSIGDMNSSELRTVFPR